MCPTIGSGVGEAPSVKVNMDKTFNPLPFFMNLVKSNATSLLIIHQVTVIKQINSSREKLPETIDRQSKEVNLFNEKLL